MDIRTFGKLSATLSSWLLKGTSLLSNWISALCNISVLENRCQSYIVNVVTESFNPGHFVSICKWCNGYANTFDRWLRREGNRWRNWDLIISRARIQLLQETWDFQLGNKHLRRKFSPRRTPHITKDVASSIAFPGKFVLGECYLMKWKLMNGLQASP